MPGEILIDVDLALEGKAGWFESKRYNRPKGTKRPSGRIPDFLIIRHLDSCGNSYSAVPVETKSGKKHG